MKRKVIYLMAKIINETGINVLDETLNMKFLRFVICQVLLAYANFTLIMYSSSHRENFYQVISTVSYMGGATITMVGLAAILKYKGKVGQMLHQMDNNIFTYPDEDLIEVNYPWLLEEKNGVKMYYFVMGIDLLTYTVICSISFIQWSFYGEITIFLFPAWSPWPNNGLRSALATLISQHFSALSAVWFYYVMLMFIVITAIEFARQFYRLRVAVRLLRKRTGMILLKKGITEDAPNDENHFHDVNYIHSQFDSQFRTKYNQIFKQNIINCIKHHQLLIKNHEMFRPFFETIFSFELASCSLTFALGLYCLVDASDLQLVVNLFGAAFIISFNFFARCYIGEQFSKLNAQLQHTILYDSNWHEQTIENQKLLYFFHRQAEYPFDLIGFSIFKASLSTFADIIRSTYSSFNVINASVHTE